VAILNRVTMHHRPIVVWIIGLLSGSFIVEAHSVPTGYQRVAIEYDLPPVLLYAVALTESGQSALSEGRFRPWPWALNINGEGHYFTSRQEALQALQVALANANSSVDIGLMQINWRYHHAALGSPWQALDPYHNLRVAAAILRDCLNEHINWMQTAGCYHAPNDSRRARAYASRVQQHWRQIADIEQERRFEHP
jgi:soluble lytic murein transglycosylase-like protein